MAGFLHYGVEDLFCQRGLLADVPLPATAVFLSFGFEDLFRLGGILADFVPLSPELSEDFAYFLLRLKGFDSHILVLCLKPFVPLIIVVECMR